MIAFEVAVIGVAVLLVAYSYAGYPLALIVADRLVRRRPAGSSSGAWPMVSITIPAYNEERAIAATIERVLELDYPADRRQIVVVSDASTDRTDEIVRGFASRGVELLRLPARGGKTAAENAALPHLRGEIIVNTDASVRIHRDALRPLVAAFHDPGVGVASGRDVSVARVDESANVGESGYVGYEMWVRRLETQVASIVGASGCFYASRAHLHRALVPEALSRDFASALIARENGFRAVSVDEAVCFVPRTAGLGNEYRRKVRTIARGMETLYYKRHLLNPLRYGVFSWLLVSHKLCRWLVPWTLAAASVCVVALAVAWPPARWAAGLLAAGITLGALGWLWPAGRRMPRVLAVPAFALAGNVAAMHAAIKAMRRELNPVWEPTRRTAPDAG